MMIYLESQIIWNKVYICYSEKVISILCHKYMYIK